VARYWLAGIVQRFQGAEFPWGTFAVNALGSFVLGVVLALSLDRGILQPNARLFLAVGLCGGFTTMSTFSYETLALLRDGSLLAAATNAAGTVVVCLTAVWLGDAVGRLV
jgi:CrcB protein